MRNLLYLKEVTHKLKPDVGIATKFPSLAWGEEGIAIGAHCDDGSIMTKNGSRAQIGV